MQNNLYIILMISFILFDLYKMINREINFYSFYRPLILVIVFRFIVADLNVYLYHVSLVYMVINYFCIFKYLNKKEERLWINNQCLRS